MLIIPSPTKLRKDIVTLTSVRPSFRSSFRNVHPCVHSRINILQWILTKLGTYLVLTRIWNTIDFQGHRSKVKVTGSNFLARGYATLCVALVLFVFVNFDVCMITIFMLYIYYIFICIRWKALEFVLCICKYNEIKITFVFVLHNRLNVFVSFTFWY